MLSVGFFVAVALASTHVDAAAIAAPAYQEPAQTALAYVEGYPARPARVLPAFTQPPAPVPAAAPSLESQLLPWSESWPPPEAVVVQLVRAAFPEDPDTAERIVRCESHAGQDAGTYDLEASHAGPMQLARSVWEPFFRERYGWSWQTIVTYLPVHLKAARIVWERGSWAAWECA